MNDRDPIAGPLSTPGNQTVGSLEEQENAIFKPWRERRPDLVADGVVEETRWLQSRPRLLFLMKEVNDKGGGGWDSREFLLGGARARTWDVVTRWVKGIRALPDILPWKPLSLIGVDDRREELSTIAHVNLKKSPGGNVTNNEELARASTEDAMFVSKQLALYPADLVICCGSVVADLHDDLRPSEFFSSDWGKSTRGVSYRQINRGGMLISYSHPEARIDKNLLHYGLIDAVAELYQAQ